MSKFDINSNTPNYLDLDKDKRPPKNLYSEGKEINIGESNRG